MDTAGNLGEIISKIVIIPGNPNSEIIFWIILIIIIGVIAVAIYGVRSNKTNKPIT
jgi:hypothetical protein